MPYSSIRFHRSLSGRMLLFGVVPTVAILMGIIVYMTMNLYSTLREKTEVSLQNLAVQVATEVERGNTRAVLAAKIMAFAQEHGLFGRRAESSAYARRILSEFPEFTGAYFGYEPNADQDDRNFLTKAEAQTLDGGLDTSGRFIPHWYRHPMDNNALSLRPLLDMETSLYYQGVKDFFHGAGTAHPMITEPYVHQGKMIVEHTYPIVFDDQFRGIAGVDRALNDIEKLLKTIKERDSIDIFLISRAGRFIAATTDREGELKTKPVSDTPYLDLFGEFYRNRGTNGFTLATDPVDGRDYYFASTFVDTGNWMVVLRESEEDVIGPIRENLISIGTIALLGFGTVLLLSLWTTTSTTRRIRQAVDAVDHVASGDLSVELTQDVGAADEIGRMNNSLNRVVSSYRGITDVCRAIAEGDFSKRIEKRSNQDLLAEAINLMAVKRKQAEDMLRDREEHLQAVVTSVVDAIITSDSHGTVRSFNKAAERIFGYAAPEVIDRNFKMLMPEQYHSQQDGFLAQYQQTDNRKISGVGQEVMGKRKDGSTFPMELAISEMHTADQIMLVGIARDITDRKHAEAELRQNEQRFRALYEAASDPFFVFDQEGVMDCNNALVKMLGYTDKAQIIGTAPYNLSPEFQPDGQRSDEKGPAMIAITQQQGSHRFEWAHLRADGKPLPFEVALTPVTLNERPAIFAALRDLTERKRAETTLLRAREVAEAATESRSRFLANMSHEIRTPLNGIIGFTTLALRTELTPKQRDYLHKIQISSNALLTLINDILDFSKIEAGKLDMEHIDFQLQSVLEELADLFADQAAQRDVELVIAREFDVPSALKGDPARLRQILINLISNAVKFTEAGDIFINVHTIAQGESQVRLRFSVRDTGIGIPPENLGKLFTSFTQADGSTTRKYGGTGLGLTICKQLVELMHGEIGAESSLGQGSTFWFEIPFRRQLGHNEPSYQLSVDLRGLKVLVVDDNTISRQVLVEMLHSFGFDVDAVASGEQALGSLLAMAAKHRSYDLVLMDWKMPGLDGLATSRQIRKTPQFATLPIVMVTAFGREEERHQGEAIGINAFLTKPVQQSVLFNTLMAVFGQTETGATSERHMVTAASLRSVKLRGASLLLVEDNLINQEVAESMLTAEGIRVDVANNGLEAVARVRQCRYDAVLMDMQMPEMDGYEATRRIREDKRLDQLPIIAMTAHAMEGDREKCLNAGMNDYISKPIDPKQLFEILGKWVSTKGRRRDWPKKELRRPMSEQDDALEAMPGFDVEEALRRLRGHRQLYRKLLGDLARNHAEDGAQIRAALEAGEIDQARSIAHRLKGVAGNLAAKELYAEAARLESAVAALGKPGQTKNPVSDYLESLNQALIRAIDAIRSLEADEQDKAQDRERSGGTDEPPLEPEQILQIARRIKEAAEMGDITEIQRALELLPQGFQYRAKLMALADALDLSGLTQVAAELEKTIPEPSEN